MKALSGRFQLLIFLGWSVAVVSVTALAGKIDPADQVKEELVREVERLEGIESLNSGQLDADRAGLSPAIDLEKEKAGQDVKTKHLTSRRSLSQR